MAKPILTETTTIVVKHKEMPTFRSHKEVKALQIETIESTQAGYKLHFMDDDHKPIEVDGPMMTRYMAKPGDYYIVYPDGYTSISPAKAFEDGYTRIERKPDDVVRKLLKGDNLTLVVKSKPDGKLEISSSTLEHSPAVVLKGEVLEVSWINGSALVLRRPER